MRSLQDYRNIYREIAQSLGYRGDSVELLVQLLSNATYIEEVENITYMQEASLERASLMNSKIQHCVNNMYSVYRGACPRVLIHVRPTKYQVFKPYQEIATSSNFKVYYLGSISESGMSEVISEWKKSSSYPEPIGISQGLDNDILQVNPIKEESYYIYGFIAESVVSGKEYVISEKNPYYFDIPETGLSNDMYVEVAKSGQKAGDLENWKSYQATRIFSEHILGKVNYNTGNLEPALYDLTLPGFGSRLYFSPDLELSDRVRATYFKFTSLDKYQEGELRRISIRGMEILPMSSDFLDSHGIKDIHLYPEHRIYRKAYEEDEENNGGLIIIPETQREELQSIHYNASRDRYVNSIVRSNSDMGRLLEQMYPEHVRTNGTSCSYYGNYVVIWYIPRSSSNLLTTDQISNFRDNHKAYYISSEIDVRKAQEIKKVLTIDVELYRALDNLDAKVEEIVNPYQYRFGVYLPSGEFDSSDIKSEIVSTLSKIPEVRLIRNIGIITYGDYNEGDIENPEDYKTAISKVPYYYSIEIVINSSITR